MSRSAAQDARFCNYDDAAFANPEQFIMGRTEQHMTFNTGPHRCVGLNLARLEMKVFDQEWLKRVPPFRLDPEKKVKFSGGFNLAVRPSRWSGVSVLRLRPLRG